MPSFKKHNRRSLRLCKWDYAKPGAYFVTTCIENRDESLFGNINNGVLVLNRLGEIVHDILVDIPNHFPGVKLDEFIIMPNHVHGIIVISVGTRHVVSLQNHTEQFGKPTVGSIPTIIRSFKSAATKRINESRNTPGRAVWQTRYHDHIIRDEKSLFQIRRYIRNNPLNWAMDEENPCCGRPPRYVALPDPQRQYL